VESRSQLWDRLIAWPGGRGTQKRRAKTVARILEDYAQLPDEGVGKFTKDIWRIVEEAIANVCSLDDEREAKRAASGRS
jgi:hypothetical protein